MAAEWGECGDVAKGWADPLPGGKASCRSSSPEIRQRLSVRRWHPRIFILGTAADGGSGFVDGDFEDCEKTKSMSVASWKIPAASNIWTLRTD